MPKTIHEFRDPIHVFIKVSIDERKIIDSRPFQRLRNISQLALTSLLYPGATHKRFEHSLGVKELASRIFDVIFSDQNRENLPISRGGANEEPGKTQFLERNIKIRKSRN
jgi:HD superfamily phosphohydrolase